MSKICPICKQVHDDNEVFCGYGCGVRLIPMDEEVNPALNLGDANAISGGVNINQSKNITSHDTHYHTTTVHERSKSDSELKLDATNQLRAKAEEIMAKRGRIDSVAMGQLRPLALQLGIDDETFKSIIREVRSNRNGSTSGLSAANARYLQQAQQALQTNDMDTLSNLHPRLEAMAAISQDDNVQYLYYLSLSILYPIKSMEVYERQTDENYWRSFWAIISYIRTGKYTEATKVLALFDPLRYEKSEEDQNLLEAYFNIMKDDKDGAQEFLDEILGETTEQVKPLLRAVEITLYEEEPESLEVRFYIEHVMSKSDVVVKSQKKVDTPAPTEASAKNETKTEKKQELLTSTEAKTVSQESKISKDAEKLYTKACAASGAKRVMLLQKAADAGSLEAMYDLGDVYHDGEGVEKSMPLAIKWMTKAADAGYIKAQTALGATYLQGMEGLDQNYALSEKYLLMAAKKDNTDAQALISMLYIIMEDYEKALLWARKAVQMEHPQACLALGRIYDEGLGVEVDHKEGLKWFEKSADAGDADAQNIVGNIYSNGEYTTQDYKKAFKYYQMAAVQGHLWGMYNLSGCYVSGQGTDLNYPKAGEWLRKAAEGGLQEAIDTLKDNPGFSDATADNAKTEENLNTAELIENGDTALKAKKYKEAYSLYDKARNGGDINATKKIDAMIKLGIKQIEKLKIKEAVEILQPLSDGGEKDAQFELAMIYIDGYNVGKVKNKFIDYKNGVKLLQAIAEDGDLVALANIGWCYEVGRGYKVDYQKALDYYQKALDNGYQMNDWISKRIKTCESILIGPKATIGKAWVSQLDDQTIVVHFHIQIKNCKNKKVSFIFQTKQARLNYSVDVKPTDDNYEWRDYCYFINETDVKNKLLFGISHLETELIIKDNNRNVLCSKIMKYKVHHEARLFHKNKLTLYK